MSLSQSCERMKYILVSFLSLLGRTDICDRWCPISPNCGVATVVVHYTAALMRLGVNQSRVEFTRF